VALMMNGVDCDNLASVRSPSPSFCMVATILFGLGAVVDIVVGDEIDN
jgi:hypothetical protein